MHLFLQQTILSPDAEQSLSFIQRSEKNGIRIPTGHVNLAFLLCVPGISRFWISTLVGWSADLSIELDFGGTGFSFGTKKIKLFTNHTVMNIFEWKEICIWNFIRTTFHFFRPYLKNTTNCENNRVENI